jgi:hypothetical protein
MTLDGEGVAGDEVQERDAGARRRNIHAGFPVPGNSGVGLNLDQATIAFKIQLQRLDGRDFDRTAQRRG